MKNLLLKDGFDELDRAILEELQANGRISNADLARKIHLSQPAVHNRIKRLEKKGIIQHYTAILDRDVVGYDLLCFVHISMDSHTAEIFAEFEQCVRSKPQITECHRLTGEYDALLKIVMRNRKELDAFINNHIINLPGVGRVQTSIVLNEVKSTTTIPLK